ncbi:D-alanine--D-alanine ligase [Escovopsis weberi]|uniref:D-alanine--D-alanine ligase n=1 Tax=Escovopsis weberi TaxID=150374 RepID=A0A0M8N430_ESCWE|nr:D-alanine--D-alanine ligase [Escovopsis weberi]
MEVSLHIALIAEKRSTYIALGHSEADCAALPHDGEIQAVFDTLKGLGHHVTLVPGICALVKQLAAGQHRHWDLAFNMSQGFYGPAREAQVPALLEAYNITHTFSDATTMALCQNKANTKPVTEGSSKGIECFNKVNEPEELESAVHELRATFPEQDILVEAFLAGREFTVSILGTGAAGQVIGIREHVWQDPSAEATPSSSSPSLSPSEGMMSMGNGIKPQDGRPDYANCKSKSSNSGSERIYFTDDHDMDDPLIKAACQVSLNAWAALGCRDAGRVDLRFDNDGPDAIPNVLEVNPISGLLPHHSPLPVCAELSGIGFETLLAAIVASALERKSETLVPPEQDKDGTQDAGMEIPLVIIESE